MMRSEMVALSLWKCCSTVNHSCRRRYSRHWDVTSSVQSINQALINGISLVFIFTSTVINLYPGREKLPWSAVLRQGQICFGVRMCFSICMRTSAVPRSSCPPSEWCNQWCLCCRYPWEQSIREQHWSPSCPPASQWQENRAALRRHITVSYSIQFITARTVSNPNHVASKWLVNLLRPRLWRRQLTAGSHAGSKGAIVRGVMQNEQINKSASQSEVWNELEVMSHLLPCLCCVHTYARHVRLTHNLKGEGGFVFKAVHFNSQLVNAGVLPLSRADEHDAVGVAVPDVDPLCVHRLTVLHPGHRGFGLPLRREDETQGEARFRRNDR